MSDIPAGWYPDPAGSGAARWWSGAAWTEHLRHREAPHPASTPSAAAAPPAPWAAAPSGVLLPSAQGSTPIGSGIVLPGAGSLVGSPNTVGIWLLTSAPVAMNVSAIVVTAVAVMSGLPDPPVLAIALPVILLEWIAAGFDRWSLRRRGYTPPSLLWMLLLPPLVYFIRRGRVVRAAGQRAWPPELVYFLQVAMGMVLGFAAFGLGYR